MKVIFVHVGKCAGGSLLAQFHENSISYNELHCGNSPTSLLKALEADDSRTEYVISVRDPVSRFLSAFNFDKHEKIIGGKGSNNALWNEIYATFTSANHLCESLASSDPYLRNLAVKTFFDSNLHIHFTLSWYLPLSCLLRLPLDRTSIIRTEFVEHDLDRFLEKYSLGTSKKMRKDKDAKKFHDQLGIDDPLYLSDVSKVLLSSVYDADYRILDYFYENGLISERYTRAF